MLIEEALALYDEGAALPNVLEQLLTSAGDRRIEVGSQIIKNALSMPDGSPHHIHTPVKKEFRPGCLEVGDALIVIAGSPYEDLLDERHYLILLTLDDPSPPKLANASILCDTCRLSQFVAQMVSMRACCSADVIRNWLASIHLPLS
jgi:hypothetical protein